MQFDIITLFPEMITPVTQVSILKRAQESGLVKIKVHPLRDYSQDKHRVTDDHPYGGGVGMVLKPEPLFAAVEAIQTEGKDLRVLLASPQGRLLDQRWAQELSREGRRLVILCGHYEGIDERVRTGLSVEEFSIGNYILTGGELAALVLLDVVVRLLPGALGDPSSLQEESFSNGLLEYPHYTRPAVFRGMTVPEVLMSGHHGQITRWRRQQALWATLKKRPDLWERAVQSGQITEEDLKLLDELQKDQLPGKRKNAIGLREMIFHESDH